MKQKESRVSKAVSAQNENINKVFGTRIPLLARLFGCWHFRLSRPITLARETYCVCVKCGARIRFDTDKLTIVGEFYYAPQQSLYAEYASLRVRGNLRKKPGESAKSGGVKPEINPNLQK